MERKAFRAIADASIAWEGHHHGDLRRALLRTALWLLETEGPNALSIRRLAAEVGASHSAPLYYFKDRAALSIALAAVAFQDLGDALSSIRPSNNPRESLLELFLGYVDYALAHPALYRFMYSSGVSDVLVTETTSSPIEADRMEVLQAKAAVFNLFVTTISAGQKANVFRAGQPDVFARVMTSLAHGLSHEFIDERLSAHMTGPRARRKHARQLFERVMDGLARPESRR